MPITVCLPGAETNLWDLPASRFDRDESRVSGGMRSALELAFAIATMGRDVELRGSLPRVAFGELSDATGLQPLTGMEERPLRPDDFVIVPGGLARHSFGRYVLGPGRVVLLALGPPGLTDWPLNPGWSPPEFLTIDPESVGRPEHFRSIASLGFELWTQSAPMAEAARAAGVECQYIGSGSPVPYPSPEAKEFDVVVLEANRWAPLAHEVLEGLGLSTLIVPRLPRDEVLSQISRGTLLVFPSRIEGRARVLIESRAMGTVPVALTTNRFAEGLSEEKGVALASSIDDMRSLIPQLLADRSRLDDLIARGRSAAAELEDWAAYRRRVEEALERPSPVDEGHDALAELGIALRDGIQRELLRTKGELRALRARRSVRLALASSRIVRRTLNLLRPAR